MLWYRFFVCLLAQLYGHSQSIASITHFRRPVSLIFRVMCLYVILVRQASWPSCVIKEAIVQFCWVYQHIFGSKAWIMWLTRLIWTYKKTLHYQLPTESQKDAQEESDSYMSFLKHLWLLCHLLKCNPYGTSSSAYSTFLGASIRSCVPKDIYHPWCISGCSPSGISYLC